MCRSPFSCPLRDREDYFSRFPVTLLKLFSVRELSDLAQSCDTVHPAFSSANTRGGDRVPRERLTIPDQLARVFTILLFESSKWRSTDKDETAPG